MIDEYNVNFNIYILQSVVYEKNEKFHFFLMTYCIGTQKSKITKKIICLKENIFT